MSKIKTLTRLLKENPRGILIAIYNDLVNTGVLNNLSDTRFIKWKYLVVFGKRLDLSKPKTFNEKLQWLKLYNRRPLYNILVDKFEVKQYVKEILGDSFIIPTYGIWDSVDSIEFDKLPNQFVLKCTHDSGSVVICKDKTTFIPNSARRVLQTGLKRNLFYWGREWPYKDVKPRIIAEKYLNEIGQGDTFDYKFFCFSGKVHFFKIDFDRFTNHRANYYSREGHILNYGEKECPPDHNKHIDMPDNLESMIQCAEKLSSGIPFLRVDFYNVDGNIYFGEMTFFPASGFGPFIEDRDDLEIGNLIKL